MRTKMDKLKTLKELEEGKYDFKGLVRLDHIREEIIKWIKTDPTMFYNHWICNFFNLNNEDFA